MKSNRWISLDVLFLRNLMAMAVVWEEIPVPSGFEERRSARGVMPILPGSSTGGTQFEGFHQVLDLVQEPVNGQGRFGALVPGNCRLRIRGKPLYKQLLEIEKQGLEGFRGAYREMALDASAQPPVRRLSRKKQRTFGRLRPFLPG